MLASVFFEEVGRGERIRAESRREARGGLKTSLRPDFERSEELVGARGFEPPTPRSRTEDQSTDLGLIWVVPRAACPQHALFGPSLQLHRRKACAIWTALEYIGPSNTRAFNRSRQSFNGSGTNCPRVLLVQIAGAQPTAFSVLLERRVKLGSDRQSTDPILCVKIDRHEGCKLPTALSLRSLSAGSCSVHTPPRLRSPPCQASRESGSAPSS